MRKLSLTLLVCAASAISLSQVKLSSPADTIQSFASAIKSGKVDDAAKCVLNAKPTAAVRKILESGTRGMPLTVHVKNTRNVKDAASAQIVSMLGNASQNLQSINETVNFKKTGDSWLIVSPSNTPSEPSLINMAAFMLVKGDRFVQKQTGGTRSVSCLTNVKQLALGCIIYAGDNDYILKMKAATWSNLIKPYIKNMALFTCPQDKAGTQSYSFNTDLSGKNMAVVAEPAKTVLLYEGKNKKLVFRHEGRASVAFVDGHAKLITKEEAKNVRWKP